jgi:hypothetical protein
MATSTDGQVGRWGSARLRRGFLGPFGSPPQTPGRACVASSSRGRLRRLQSYSNPEVPIWVNHGQLALHQVRRSLMSEPRPTRGVSAAVRIDRRRIRAVPDGALYACGRGRDADRRFRRKRAERALLRLTTTGDGSNDGALHRSGRRRARSFASKPRPGRAARCAGRDVFVVMNDTLIAMDRRPEDEAEPHRAHVRRKPAMQARRSV